MTAVTEIEVQRIKDALLVPNRALRFKPPEVQKVAVAPRGSFEALPSAASSSGKTRGP